MKRLATLLSILPIVCTAAIAGATNSYTRQIPIGSCTPIEGTPIYSAAGDSVTFTYGSAATLVMMCDLGFATNAGSEFTGINLEYQRGSASDSIALDVYQSAVEHTNATTIEHYNAEDYDWSAGTIGSPDIALIGGTVALTLPDNDCSTYGYPCWTNRSIYALVIFTSTTGTTSGGYVYDLEISYDGP